MAARLAVKAAGAMDAMEVRPKPPIREGKVHWVRALAPHASPVSKSPWQRREGGDASW